MPRMRPADGFLSRRADGRALRRRLDARHSPTWPGTSGFGYFKLAVVAEGIHNRYLKGKTVGEGFTHFGDAVPKLLDAALQALADYR